MPNSFCVASDASHLLARATAIITVATCSVPSPLNSMLTLTIIPTPMRKYGMKMALPTNSRWVISGETLGTYRLSTRPTRKAPSSPSMPIYSIIHAPRNVIASTKMNCVTLSSWRRKKKRAMRGKKKNITKNTTDIFAKSRNQKPPVMLPLNSPPTTASTSSVSVSVMAVAPTAMVTLRWCDRP